MMTATDSPEQTVLLAYGATGICVFRLFHLNFLKMKDFSHQNFFISLSVMLKR